MNIKSSFKLAIISLSFAGILSTQTVMADGDMKKPVSSKKQTELGLYLDASEAYKKITQNPDKILFIDVRTRAETNFLGMPENADANIPYMLLNEWYSWNDKKNSYKMDINSKFLSSLNKRLVAKGLTKNDDIILICRSGSRSAKAANLLAKNGFTNVYTVIDGYEGDKSKTGLTKGQRVINGWKNAGLPWSYKLAKNKMYINQ